ncbi:hypothetical protein QVD17_21178 [Tagetes erecta]|uniref:Uncharacterized protein n=1 Tax=Tagetes erecta TaxID=13708 RepID=A0AAD8KT17_TARER|nr:hypothetical protein QVD17_21178 [Tagetes erecta]
MINEIIYSNIQDEIYPDSLKAFVKIAYQCLKKDRKERPLMSDVVMALTTAYQYQCLKLTRARSMPKVIDSEQSVDKHDYLGRHAMQLKDLTPENRKTHNKNKDYQE